MLKPEIKKLVDAGKMLPLMEAFYTIQGEGYHKGTAAYFISADAMTAVIGVTSKRAGMRMYIRQQPLRPLRRKQWNPVIL